MRLRLILWGCFMLWMVGNPAFADINSDMKNWFDEMQSYGNFTQPGMVEGQTRNVLTGGGLYVRNPVRNYQIYSVTPPSFKAGCGGIDLFAGSFSFINTDNFVSLLRNIGNNALGYAFEMALCTISPDICDYLKYLQDQIAKMNSLNINSCKAAEGIVQAAHSVITEEKEGALARSLGTLYGDFTDAFQSYDDWRQNADTRKSLRQKAITSDPSGANKDLLDPGNVMWNAMGKLDVSLDNELKQLMMSLTGTAIIHPTAESGEQKAYVEYWKHTDITLAQLVGTFSTEGGGGGSSVANSELNLLTCNNVVECKELTPSRKSVKPFIAYVDPILNNIANNIKGRGPQSQSDLKLLAISSLPVWKLIELTAELPSGQAILDNYKGFIALDIAKSYVISLIDMTADILTRQHKALAPDAANIYKELQDRVMERKNEILKEYNDLVRKSVDTNQLVQYLVLLEKEMNAVIPSNVYGSMKAFSISLQ